MVKPYLSPTELAACVPYTEGALRMLRATREHREGVHYHRRGRRIIYDWAAIERWIRGQAPAAEPVATESGGADVVPLFAGRRGVR